MLKWSEKNNHLIEPHTPGLGLFHTGLQISQCQLEMKVTR